MLKVRKAWTRVLQWLDKTQYPQQLVAMLRRRGRVKGFAPYSASSHEGVHAVGLSVANPMLSHQALLADFVPKSFGSWRDYAVVGRMVGAKQVVALLFDPKTSMELSLVMPRHTRFPVWRFRFARTMRLTREGIRSGLVTVRDTRGMLLAVGVLEPQERAGFSYPWGGSQ